MHPTMTPWRDSRSILGQTARSSTAADAYAVLVTPERTCVVHYGGCRQPEPLIPIQWSRALVKESTRRSSDRRANASGRSAYTPRTPRRPSGGENATSRATPPHAAPPRRPPRTPLAVRATPGYLSPGDVEVVLGQAESGAPPDLTDPRVVRHLLHRHGLRPNKGFGQHLLEDRAALEAMVEAAEIGATDTVLEVGAGMGVLTVALAERARRVVAVELERDILPVLRETTARFQNVEIIARNLLDVHPEEVFGQAPYKLVANLPYYITAPTLRHFLEAANRPARLVVMVQKEVAERMVAAPRDLSLLGLSVQFYGQARLVRIVPSTSFFPPPKVDSAIVRVDIHHEPPLDPTLRRVLFGIAHAGFAERRKQLHNTLARNLRVPRETIEAWLAATDIDPTRRAETLSVDDWVRLARAAAASGVERLLADHGWE